MCGRDQPAARRADRASTPRNRHTLAPVREQRRAPVERARAATHPPYVRRSSALAAAAVALAAAPQAAAQSTGGTQYENPPRRRTAPAFAIEPATVAPGATLTVRYRIAGR